MRLAALLRRYEYFPSFWNGALLADDDQLSRVGLHGRAAPVGFQAGPKGVDLTPSARARVGARPGHQTSASNRPHYRWCSHVQVTAYRRAPYALLSTLRPADEVGAHEPFTGSLLPNSARILLRLLRLRRNKRRSPDGGVSYHTAACATSWSRRGLGGLSRSSFKCCSHVSASSKGPQALDGLTIA